MASIPPAKTRLDRPDAIAIAAESSACIPDAQFRWTV